MLTTDRGVAAWYGVDADIDPRPGGTYRVGWGDEVAEATVDAVEPLRRLRLVYDPADPSGAEEWPLRWALEGASSPWRVAACRTVAVLDRATGWRQVLDGLGLVRTPRTVTRYPPSARSRWSMRPTRCSSPVTTPRCCVIWRAMAITSPSTCRPPCTAPTASDENAPAAAGGTRHRVSTSSRTRMKVPRSG
ncbi:MAG: SRPBCC domain-containing protein [Actinobacteria bacterium]|nr:SRPBCC domain-containing protein [Actinomycetota bacterium]